MPNCFQLFRKGSNEPASLQKVDEEICAHLQIPCDPKLWAHGWYNIIGFSIAMGCHLGSQELRDKVARVTDNDPDVVKILTFLECCYSSDAWVERK